MIVAVMTITPVVCASILNLPRPGDRLTVACLKQTPAFLDSANLCPILTGIKAYKTEDMSVWAPAPGDSLSSVIVMTGHDMEYLINVKDNLFCHYEVRPGYTRKYTQPLPYGATCQMSEAMICSKGHIDGISGYHTNGTCHTEILPGLSVVTTEGDTLTNVVCHKVLVTDTVGYTDGSKHTHESNHRRWYAPGYRYPVLESKIDKLYYTDTDSVDINISWRMIDVSVQESEIENDAHNEQIRRLVAENKNKPTAQPAENSHSQGCSKFPDYISWSDDYSEIIVSDTFSDNCITSILVCDIGGRVYFVRECGADCNEVRINTESYPPGLYLLNVSKKSAENESFRFMRR